MVVHQIVSNRVDIFVLEVVLINQMSVDRLFIVLNRLKMRDKLDLADWLLYIE